MIEIDEKALEEEYRRYTIFQMKIAMSDASVIAMNGDKAIIAATLFKFRVSPFHFWRQKRITEIMKEGEKYE